MELEAGKTLECAEEQLKELLKNTPARISITSRNSQDLICDALELTQSAIRTLLRLD